MKLLIALVNYNSTDLLCKCLQSIQQHTINADYRIVVVDNNSQDGAVECIKKDFPNVEVIPNSTNNGYAMAVNQAIRLFDSEYILLLNPDIEVTSGAIDALATFMDTTPDVGIAGGQLRNPDGTLQFSCRTFFTLPVILYRRTFLGKFFPDSPVLTRHFMTDWDHQSIRDVDWVLGACMMIRRKALQDVGLMDERFFMYFEDVDWCYRMKKSGWRVCYVPEAVMMHHHRRESAQGINRTLGFLIMSMFHFYDKWGNFLYFLRKYRVALALFLLLVVDLAAINISFVGAYFIRKGLLTFLEKPQLPFFYYQNFLLFTSVIMPLVLYFLGLYTIKPGELWVDELFRVGKGVAISALFLMAGSYLTQGYEFSRTMNIIFAFLCIVVMFVFRWSIIAWYNSLRKRGFNLRRTLIVGIGERAVTVYRELQRHREIGFDIVGFVSVPADQEAQDETLTSPILGTVENIPELIQTQNITEIILVNSSDSHELISQCKQDGMNVYLITNLYNLSMHETTLEELAGIPMLYVKGKPFFTFKQALKRGGDLLMSSVGLLLLSPVMLVMSILIKFASPGPIIVRCKRLGKMQKPFMMYKFRTTKAVAEESSHPHSRWTYIGKWLRRHRLDLLPQLVNVFKGEMSLVGPRPLTGQNESEYGNGREQKRFEITPGMTGLWQVSGQNGTSLYEMFRIDVYYMLNWSLSNDLKILLRSIALMIFQRKELSELPVSPTKETHVSDEHTGNCL